MKDVLILTPKFIDRAGRMVYDVHTKQEQARYLVPGDFLGQLRMNIETLDGGIEMEKIKRVDSPE